MTSRYQISTARREFITSLAEIELVLKKVAPPRKTDPDIKNYILGASVLFVNAKLENYISDLFTGITSEICRNNTPMETIPNSLLGWAFLRDESEIAAKRFIATGDEGAYIARTGDYINNCVLSTTENYLTSNRFRGISDKSYPSVSNLKKMYKRLGVDSIFGKLKKRLHRDVMADVKSLNDSRGSLAHSGITGTFTYRDIKDIIKNVSQLVSALDKETFYYLRSEQCESAWKPSV